MERADGGGFAVLRARAFELESDVAWGVVRQLFAPVVPRPLEGSSLFAGAAGLALGVLGLDRPVPRGRDGLGAALHALYWLVANLAERRPVVVAVDDVHWADPASGRFVEYLARRLADLPVVLAVTVRSGDPGARSRIGVLRATPGAVVLEPRPLSMAGSRRLLAMRMHRPPQPEFTAACHAATGGNPYLVGELASQLLRDGIAPLDRHAKQVHDAPATFGRDQLTPSELRVARMAADGVSNKQIAQTLFVSLRTVETHLTHAYGKLGIRSRAELGDALASRFDAPHEPGLLARRIA